MRTIYRCSDCGSELVQVVLPAFVSLNAQDGKEVVSVDHEANKDKTYCPDCDLHGQGYDEVTVKDMSTADCMDWLISFIRTESRASDGCLDELETQKDEWQECLLAWERQKLLEAKIRVFLSLACRYLNTGDGLAEDSTWLAQASLHLAKELTIRPNLADTEDGNAVVRSAEPEFVPQFFG